MDRVRNEMNSRSLIRGHEHFSTGQYVPLSSLPEFQQIASSAQKIRQILTEPLEV